MSVLIFQQGWSLLLAALRQLTDAGVSPATRTVLLDALRPLLPSAPLPSSDTHAHAHANHDFHADAGEARLLGVSELRAMRTGAHMRVDLTAHVPAALPVAVAAALEARIRDALVDARRDVQEVRVRFRPVRDGEGEAGGEA